MQPHQPVRTFYRDVGNKTDTDGAGAACEIPPPAPTVSRPWTKPQGILLAPKGHRRHIRPARLLPTRAEGKRAQFSWVMARSMWSGALLFWFDLSVKMLQWSTPSIT